MVRLMVHVVKSTGQGLFESIYKVALGTFAQLSRPTESPERALSCKSVLGRNLQTKERAV